MVTETSVRVVSVPTELRNGYLSNASQKSYWMSQITRHQAGTFAEFIVILIVTSSLPTTYKGGRGTAPLILNLGTGCRRLVKFTTRPLYSQERNPVPI